MQTRSPMRPWGGWFVISFSRDLHQRSVHQLRYFAEPLLLFRNGDGVAVALGSRNRVFDGVPRASRTARQAVRSWPVCERNGLVFAYFHPSGDDPRGDVPHLDELESADWTAPVTRRYTLAADVHALLDQTLTASQRRHDDDPHPRVEANDFRLRTRTEMLTPMGLVSGTLDVQAYGAGYSLVRFTGAVETLVLTTVTPIDAERIDVRYTCTVKRLPDERMTRLLEQRLLTELERLIAAGARGRKSDDLDPGTRADPHRADPDPAPAWHRWAQPFYI